MHSQPTTNDCINYIHTGYGFYIGYLSPEVAPTIKHRHIVWHSGGQVGVSVIMILYPTEEMVGVALTNKGYVPGLDNLVFNAAELIYEFVD